MPSSTLIGRHTAMSGLVGGCWLIRVTTSGQRCRSVARSEPGGAPRSTGRAVPGSATTGFVVRAAEGSVGGVLAAALADPRGVGVARGGVAAGDGGVAAGGVGATGVSATRGGAA